jgi:hypothetical protein
MATKKATMDQYLNRYIHSLTEATVNQGVEELMNTALTVKDRKAILIYAVEYHIHYDTILIMDDEEDSVVMGISSLKHTSAPNHPDEIGLLDYLRINGRDNGTPADRSYFVTPIVHKFPEPLIAHPASLYLHQRGISLSAAYEQWISLRYKYIDLSEEVWRELWESTLVQNLA